jgi:hypothetical protein
MTEVTIQLNESILKNYFDIKSAPISNLLADSVDFKSIAFITRYRV